MQIAAWAEATMLAEALRRSGHLYMVVNAAHVLGIGMMLGAIIPLDLRLIGLIRTGPIQVLGPFLSRAAGVGFAIAIVTGISLWSVGAREYVGNPAFLWKVALIACGLAVIVLQHRQTGWRRAIETGVASTATRILAALSLTVWLSVLLSGRWIGFL